MRWPELKNAAQQKAWIFFQDESGFTQKPSVRTTWSPQGKTPVLRTRGNHGSKTSVAAALGFRWDGSRPRLLSRTKPDSFDTGGLIGFLKQLKTFVAGGKVIPVWDHPPAQRSKLMKEYLSQQRSTMTLSAAEFIRRFPLHMLRDGFRRNRYYGFPANRYRREKLAQCRQLPGMRAAEAIASARPLKDYRRRYEELTGCTPRECPQCHRGRMVAVEMPPRIPGRLSPIMDSS